MIDPRVEACERMAREFDQERAYYRRAERFPWGIVAVLVGISIATAVSVTIFVRAVQ